MLYGEVVVDENPSHVAARVHRGIPLHKSNTRRLVNYKVIGFKRSYGGVKGTRRIDDLGRSAIQDDRAVLGIGKGIITSIRGTTTTADTVDIARHIDRTPTLHVKPGVIYTP